MKKIRIFALASFLLTVSVAAAAPYGFSHGPYLQELTPTGVTFVFTTSDKGFSSHLPGLWYLPYLLLSVY